MASVDADPLQPNQIEAQEGRAVGAAPVPSSAVRRIMIAIDPSEAGARAAAFGLDLARSTRAEVVLVAVLTTSTLSLRSQPQLSPEARITEA